MKITNYGRFTQYMEAQFILYRNEAGQDWNAMQMGTQEVPRLVVLGDRGVFISSVHDVWAMVDDKGNITNVDTDPSTLVPFDKMIIGIDDATTSDVVAGMIYVDGEIRHKPDPLPPTPEELREQMPQITQRQLRLTLVRNGISLSTVQAALYGMEDGLAKDEAIIEWESAGTYNRIDPTLLTIANALSLTPEQVDAMWEQALAA